MYIDRIHIDWDKVSPGSYLERIPAICLLQELRFRKPVILRGRERKRQVHAAGSRCHRLRIQSGRRVAQLQLLYPRREFPNFIKTFTRTGIFLMDEPEAALSPNRQLSLFSRISEMAREGSQYIIVTHAPILLAIPGADIIQFDGRGMRYVDYEDTESYRITKMFINHREMMVESLTGGM